MRASGGMVAQGDASDSITLASGGLKAIAQGAMLKVQCSMCNAQCESSEEMLVWEWERVAHTKLDQLQLR